MNSKKEDINRILFINPYGIGDVLFTTPLLKIIKEQHSGTFIGYWSNQRVSPILRNNPYIDKIFALSRGDIKKVFQESWFKGIMASLDLFKQIRSGRFNTVFDFSLDYRYGLVSKLAGIKNRIGYDYKGRGAFLTQKIRLEGYSHRHIVDYYLDLLKFIGLDKTNAGLNLFVSQADNIFADRFLEAQRVSAADTLIGISPGAGASWGKGAYLKHWPKEKFAFLADRLISQLKAKVIIFGDEQEKGICADMIAAMRQQPIDACCKMMLGEFSGLLKRCALLVTNDGGPLHMAVALGVKTVSIFGPVDEKVYGPYSDSGNYHSVVKKDMPCRPCYKNFRMGDCKAAQKCLKDLTADEVYEKVRELL